MLTALMALAIMPCVNAQTIFQKAQKPQPSLYSDKEGALNNKVKPYLRAGLSMGLFCGENSNGTGEVLGFTAEGGLQIPFKDPKYGVQPGLRFVMKGATAPMDEGDSKNTTTRFNCMEIPVNFYFKLPTGERSLLQFAVGPYMSYAVSGSLKYQGNKYDLFDVSNAKRFDVGVDVEIGYQYRRIQFNMGAGVGFIPAFGKDDEGKSSPENGSVYWTIGYVFN